MGKYYANNSSNKEYLKLINNINELNKKISSADKSDDLLLLKNELKKLKTYKKVVFDQKVEFRLYRDVFTFFKN